MPTRKPRINVTVPDHLYRMVARLAEVEGRSMSSVLVRLLEELTPHIEQLVAKMEAEPPAYLRKFGHSIATESHGETEEQLDFVGGERGAAARGARATLTPPASRATGKPSVRRTEKAAGKRKRARRK